MRQQQAVKGTQLKVLLTKAFVNSSATQEEEGWQCCRHGKV